MSEGNFGKARVAPMDLRMKLRRFIKIGMAVKGAAMAFRGESLG
jgi:hypothetical protein